MDPRDSFHPARATDPQLFVLSRLIHLREFEFGDPDLPSWVISMPLSEEPYEMSSDRVSRCIEGLVHLGLVIRNEHPADDGGAPDVRFAASDACMELAHAIREELRERHPAFPTELAAQILMLEAGRQPEGFEREVLRSCLEDPPASLTPEEATSLYRRLMKEAWIFATKRVDTPLEWFPAPKTWAWQDEIRRALAERLGEMRERLANGVATRLEIGESDPLRTALGAVDRANFVPKGWELEAYRMRPIPIAQREDGSGGTTTSSPDVCATIAKGLELRPGDQVLVCGVKGGFTAALCAHLVGPSGRVECLETDQAIADHARDSLARAGLDERRVRIHLVRDVTVGRAGQQQWDAAVVNGKIPKVPRAILKQMAEGGRLLIFLQEGNSSAGQTAYLIRMDGKAIQNKALSSFSFTPIYGEFGYDPPNWQENLELVGASSHEIFVSFSSRDVSAAEALVTGLESAGLRCWLSARDHPVGRDGYAEAIMSAISQSQLFLIVLSHDSLESDHVKNELAQATNQRKTILPVRLAECPPRLPASFQYHLERYQQVDLSRQDREQVVHHALRLLEVKPLAQPGPAAATTSVVDSAAVARASKRFDVLLESAVSDGRLTATEVEELTELALEACLCESSEQALSLVTDRARALRPDISI